jgi:hypothetical protein
MKRVPIFGARRFASIAISAALFLGAISANANLLQALPEMGDLERWGAFSLGAGMTVGNDMKGTTDIYGDVGIAGNGNVNMTGNATVHGDLYYQTAGTLTMKGNSSVTGVKHHDASSDTTLNNSVTEANNTSAHAATFTSSFAYSGITSITSSMTLTAQHDRPGNSTVLNLTTLSLGSQQTLTINGSANDVFIFNISQTFLLGAQAQIVLTGGLAWDDVLFNVRGKGGTVSLGAQSTLNGILMANHRAVSMAGGSTVRGEVISDSLGMVGGSQIIRPPITSP